VAIATVCLVAFIRDAMELLRGGLCLLKGGLDFRLKWDQRVTYAVTVLDALAGVGGWVVLYMLTRRALGGVD
jgi:hypothetical protein